MPNALTSRLVPRLGDDLPTTAELAAPAPPVLDGRRGRSSIVDRRSSEAAYTTVTAITELLSELGTQPARQLAKGGLALPDSKRLAEASGTPLEDLPRLFHRADGPAWSHATARSDSSPTWARRGRRVRRRPLVAPRRSWLDRIPGPLRDLVARRTETLTAAALLDYLRWLYPAGGHWLEDGLDRLLGEAEPIGLAVAAEPVGRAPCSRANCTTPPTGSPSSSRTRSTGSTCSTTSRSSRPGRSRRRRCAAPHDGRRRGPRPRLELPGDRGIRQPCTDGRRVGRDIRAFLGWISLTGIPQPLEYLLGDTAARFGCGARVGRRRSGCPGEGVCPLRRRALCARSPSTRRSPRSGCDRPDRTES